MDSTVLNLLSSETTETLKSDFTVVCLLNAAKLTFFFVLVAHTGHNSALKKSLCLPQTHFK